MNAAYKQLEKAIKHLLEQYQDEEFGTPNELIDTDGLRAEFDYIVSQYEDKVMEGDE